MKCRKCLLRGLAIQESNSRSGISMHMKILKPRVECSEATLPLQYFDHSLRRHSITESRLLSLTFESHKDRYDVPVTL
jgi:hypothetical protein